MARLTRLEREDHPISDDLLRAIHKVSSPLVSVSDLTPLLDRVGKAHHVLIGEASHGTSEFYNWRSALTKRLVTEMGFRFIAVEGDWPDCFQVNRYVKKYPGCAKSADEVLRAQFRRWPSWMWANEEVCAFVEWLRAWNDERPAEQKVGFYGLDVYSLWESIDALSRHLKKHYPEALTAFQEVIHCFDPFGDDVHQYASASVFYSKSCEKEILALLQEIHAERARLATAEDGREGGFQVEQNAIVLKNAEAYYRAMVRRGPESWNIRDRHMMETLQRLVAFHGAGAKSIVWEHNTHVGDARYTDMGESGEVNIGQLAREEWGDEDVVLVGFSTHSGTVMAGSAWEAPMQVMAVPPGRLNSWEDALHRRGGEDKLLIFDRAREDEEMALTRGHRAIGVVYQPQYEHYGNFVPTVMPRRYDALLYIDETTALHPLKVAPVRTGEPPETYPTAV